MAQDPEEKMGKKINRRPGGKLPNKTKAIFITALYINYHCASTKKKAHEKWERKQLAKRKDTRARQTKK